MKYMALPAVPLFRTPRVLQAGNVSVYPAANPAQDIVEVESGRACQPLATLLEAAKHDVEEIRIGLTRLGQTILELPNGITVDVHNASFTDYMLYYDVTLMNPKVLTLL